MPQGRSRPSLSKRPDTYSTPAWLGNESADDFSSELRPKILRAAMLVSDPTAAWGTAGFMDGETATLRRGQATDDDRLNQPLSWPLKVIILREVQWASDGQGKPEIRSWWENKSKQMCLDLNDNKEK